KEDLLDGVVIAVDLAVNGRLQRNFLRHGPEAVGNQHLFAELLAPAFPRIEGGTRSHGKVIVEVLQLSEPAVFGQLAGIEDPRRIRIRGKASRSYQDEKHAKKVSCSIHEMIPRQATLSSR